MKNRIVAFAFVVIAFALVEGCGNKTSKLSNESRVTAAELAELMDFHAWNLPIPQSQPPVKGLRLVIIRHDGTVVPKFETKDLSSARCAPCTFILLGLRVEAGAFKGHFDVRDSKGVGDEFADFKDNVGWAISGTTVWNGNRAQLASHYQLGEKQDSILAIELVK